MFDDISKEQIHKARSRIGFFRRFSEKFFTFVLFSQYVYFFPIFLTKDPFTGYYVTRAFVVIGVLLSLLIFYSATRLSTVYCDELTDNYLNSSQEEDGFGKKLKYIFSRKENRFELLLFAVIYLLLPPKILHAGFVWLFAENGNDIFAKVKVLGITLPLLFVIYILAHLSAINYWNKERQKRVDKYQYMNEAELAREKKTEKKEHKRFKLTLIFGYFAGSMVLMFIIPALLTSLLPVLMLFLDIRLFIIALLLFFFPWIYRNCRALSKRRKFIKALTKLCKEKKYKLSKIREPYKSLFRLSNGESFSIQILHRRYSCKLVAAKKRSMPLYIQPDGTGTFLVKIRFLRLVLFSYTKSFKFGYKAEGKKVLIVNPIPQRVLLPQAEFDDMMDEGGMLATRSRYGRLYVKGLRAKTESVELDNGDIVGEFELYSAKAFLNALERDCIDKD